MLNIRKVFGARPKTHVAAELEPLLTPWGEALDPDRVWEEHPDPQFERDRWQTLNGTWQCAFVANGHDPAGDLEAVVAAAEMPNDGAFGCEIVVPFSPESLLSGVRRQLQPDELLWYRRTLTWEDTHRVHVSPGQELAASNSPLTRQDMNPVRVWLRFQAVDHACAVRVNGQLVGTHVGGYAPFAFDITDALREGANELAVCVADPSEFGGQPRGKQRFDRGDIWYTAQSGIWQAVWIEAVPEARIERLQIEADADGVLVVGVETAGDGRVRLEVLDASDTVVAAGEGEVADGTGAVALHVPDAHLWSPDDPYLYRLRVTFGDDVVHSYCGFRTVEVRRDSDGVARVFLNGEPLFVRGVLDQAYWPDGLMTAPVDATLVHDIEAMRAAGFNLMRKHIKVECARWYYHCDRLGMLVLQDMVQGGEAAIRSWDWSYKPTLFKFTWGRFRDDTPGHRRKLGAGGPHGARYRGEWARACRETVRALGGHPSVIGWSLFNEGWGQFDAREACAMVRRLDPTRVIDAVSGWYDQGCGDFFSVHNYFRELDVWPDRRGPGGRAGRGRAFLISEFGGFSHRVEGHSSLAESYGYETFDDIAEWRAAVRALLAEADALEGRGLAGYVYTQVSDIEEETNGLLTYDRRVNKLEAR